MLLPHLGHLNCSPSRAKVTNTKPHGQRHSNLGMIIPFGRNEWRPHVPVQNRLAHGPEPHIRPDGAGSITDANAKRKKNQWGKEMDPSRRILV